MALEAQAGQKSRILASRGTPGEAARCSRSAGALDGDDGVRQRGSLTEEGLASVGWVVVELDGVDRSGIWGLG